MNGLGGRVARVVALAAAGLWACVEPEAQPDADDLEAPSVEELRIDSGGQVQLSPGEGIGVAVEYAGEGRWSVETSCDTTLTALTCAYDLLVSTDELSPIAGYEGVALEEDDGLVALDAFAVSGEFLTGDDADGFGFTTSPGATVRVSALVYDLETGWGWSDDPRILSWFGNGGVHRGAPTNPVDLAPDRP
ncbi:MAG TPA: hypothetical protein VNN80_14940 [Polyangiaceae bacterium]|jgi:hypothetical protein|nr:hypothetical protein [Polyangiaceae bacterium]